VPPETAAKAAHDSTAADETVANCPVSSC